jgi:hypothetical protein
MPKAQALQEYSRDLGRQGVMPPLPPQFCAIGGRSLGQAFNADTGDRVFFHQM